MLLLSGVIQGLVFEAGRIEPFTRQMAPTWMGAIPVLTETGFAGQFRTETDVRMAVIAAEDFIRLVAEPAARSPPRDARGPAVSTRTAAREQNRERLASLGTMAAGLAHELNNPAAAARRAASDLAEALEVLAVDDRPVRRVRDRARAGRGARCDATRRDRARAITTHSRRSMPPMQRKSCSSRSRISASQNPGASPSRSRPPGSTEHGSTGSRRPPARRASAAIAWIAASLTAQGLAAEIAESTDRMGKLVKAIKAYAFMDRGDLVETDIHEGLETTLVVLGHKLKHTSIEVRRDYDRSLPKLTLRGSELNQVWTNLLANAIEALGESGTIEIATSRDGICARVDIIDDGPGIPEEIRGRVFDPFFTTKDVGEGTGLGLDTARRIVTERLSGSIEFDSTAGRTAFHIWLPLGGAEKQAATAT